MKITEIIKSLQRTLEEYGDIDVIVDEYIGGNYALMDASPEVENVGSSETRVVVIRGRGDY